MAGRNPVWGLTGGVGEVGEKLHGVERNPWIASVGAGTAGGGGAMEQQLPRRGYAAPAALRRGRSGEDRPERTSGRWRTDSEGSRGWRMAGGGGSTAARWRRRSWRTATPFWHRDGSARLGEGRRVEREGGTPLGEANREGESSSGGGVVVERTRRVRRCGDVLAERQ